MHRGSHTAVVTLRQLHCGRIGEHHGKGLAVRGAQGVRHLAVAVATTALVVLLSACTSEHNDTVPTPVPVVTNTGTSAPSAAPTSAPGPDPVLLPGGTALANLEYFNFVNNKLLAVNSNPSTTAIVENLLNSGFEKSKLEVTADKTSQLHRPADSIEFAVRTSNGCLIGQFHAGLYTSMVAPMVNGEVCLIGATATIP